MPKAVHFVFLASDRDVVKMKVCCTYIMHCVIVGHLTAWHNLTNNGTGVKYIKYPFLIGFIYHQKYSDNFHGAIYSMISCV